MRKIVINTCYGGFSLSQAAAERYAKIKGLDLDGLYFGRQTPRDDPDLIRLVEEMGSEAASGECAELTIVEIPDDVQWQIEEYDGYEHVAEKHRTWP